MEKRNMRLFHFLKTKSKRFLCHMADKEISGKVNFLFIVFSNKIYTCLIGSTDFLPSFHLFLRRVYPQIYDIEVRH